MEGLCTAEGIRLGEEACQVPGLIQQVFFSDRCRENKRGSQLIQTVSRLGFPMFCVSERVAGFLSETQQNQGIFIIFKRVEGVVQNILSKSGFFGVLLVDLQDPGNFGSLIRVSEASGITGVLYTQKGVDPFHPKVVRSSMGSLFRIPLGAVNDVFGVLSHCRERGIQTVSTGIQSQTPYYDIDFKNPTLLVFGQEGSGLPEQVMEKTDFSASIPMKTPVDSLNVAVSAGIIFYEAARQRGVLKRN
ncbi:MAG TPA: RNA methyltransferase [Nitrospiria bacterium]